MPDPRSLVDARFWACHGDHPDIDQMPIAVAWGSVCPDCGRDEQLEHDYSMGTTPDE